MGHFFNIAGPYGGPVLLVFTIWMIIDCVRSGRETYWIFIMLFTGGIGAVVYFFLFKIHDLTAIGGLLQRRQFDQRVKELKAKIYTIDNAYHHAELGEVYLKQKKWDEARKCFEAALERDPNGLDSQVHLGYALLALGKPAEAWALFEPVILKQPDYEYGELMWRAARCKRSLGDAETARTFYERLLSRHTYAEAQIEYCELLEEAGETEKRTAILNRIVAEASHAPKYQQRMERKFLRQARKALAAGASKSGNAARAKEPA